MAARAARSAERASLEGRILVALGKLTTNPTPAGHGAIALTLLATGCGALTAAVDATSPPSDAASDASTGSDSSSDRTPGGGGDAAADDAAADDAAAVNQIENPGFERPNPGCAPGWSAQLALADPVPVPHGGGWSCRVCNSTGAAAYYGLHHAPPFPSRPGSWTFQAWVREDPDAGGPPGLDLRITANNAQFVSTDQVALGGGWTRGQASIGVGPTEASTADVELSLLALGNPGRCFLVDDVSLTYVP